MWRLVLTAFLLGSLAVTSAQITPVTNAAFYPYGPGTADILDPAADDSTSGAQALSTAFPFFGGSFNELYVNTNGDISFGGAVTSYTPTPFPVTNNRVLAVYFTDVKTSYSTRAGYIYHRETTDAAILTRATSDIQTAFPTSQGSFVATWVYIATWHEVGLYGASGDGVNLRNTFQLVLITDGCKSFTLFNYDRIDFLQGSTNDGDGTTGTGPNPAQVGINGGDGIHFSLHPYSRTTDLYDLPTWVDPGPETPGPAGRWYQRTDLALVGDGPVLTCPSGWRMRGDICLRLNHRPADYPTAKSVCEENGAGIWNIRSQEDNEWLVGHLTSYLGRTGKGRGVWNGLTDEETEGAWMWADGTAYDSSGYSNWAENAVDVNNGFRNCVYMDKGLGWQWFVQRCESTKERHAFICAKPGEADEPECTP
ncbi:PREDICTED: sushi, nidogen and EGF-like domain-containing protein 1 [Branchiostoma belcheri]|uniref:Sushi, nidogen and EGF-like domain-containing protein 1 n=1 Tax=Branchiostoma belcheri TaxID=7741 RepID=A0A6P4ZMA3_BRABE|nr:PREDICTED: sushi, nidogen and EGF-like domain-containing protein 1 [Branchiostoma belcheri]